ncbi:sialidase family protein [Planococcus sp. APC 4015]|nr:sialidase family protein [Planococcus sp. APC 4015]
MRISWTATVIVVALTTLSLTGCAASAPPTTGAEHVAATTAHVHGIVASPDGAGYLLGTHDGVYPVTADGQLGARVGPEFDAMALTAVGGDLLASGHPGSEIPPGWGSPNLGIMSSSDVGRTWEPTAFVGDKDFHSLAAGIDGTVYGLATDSIEVLISTDAGATWAPTGGSLFAFSLAVDSTGRIIASTPDGLQMSSDRGVSFAPMMEAPLLYQLSTSPNRQLLVGVDNKERIWVATAGDRQWRENGSVHGMAQAIAITDTGDLLVIDDSGITALPATE